MNQSNEFAYNCSSCATPVPTTARFLPESEFAISKQFIPFALVFWKKFAFFIYAAKHQTLEK